MSRAIAVPTRVSIVDLKVECIEMPDAYLSDIILELNEGDGTVTIKQDDDVIVIPAGDGSVNLVAEALDQLEDVCVAIADNGDDLDDDLEGALAEVEDALDEVVFGEQDD